MRLAWLVVLLAVGLPTVRAVAADETLFLEVVVNGHPTGLVGQFTERNGKLFATPADLRTIGLKTPKSVALDDATPIPLSELPGIKTKLEEQTQRLDITADARSLIPTKLGVSGVVETGAPGRSPYGMVLDYDTVATRSAGTITGGVMTDWRLAGPYGVLSSTGLTSFTPPERGEGLFARLDTTWTYSDPANISRYRLGDVITGGLGWTRPVRLGGVQWTTDFTLRPDLVTFPIPSLSGFTKVPSSVDILVNGVRQISQNVPPGPFQVAQPPIITGAGEVSVAVTNALGQQTTTTVPFYASNQLLKVGLSSYSFELGAVRQNYGDPRTDYGQGAGMATFSRGITDWLTLDAHAEAMDDLGMLGVGATARLWTLGILSIAGAGSFAIPRSPVPAAGALPVTTRRVGKLVSASFQRQSRGLNLSLAVSFASSGFEDVAGMTGTPYPRSSVQASVGVPLGRIGSIGVGFVSQRGGISTSSIVPASTGNLMLATANYSVPVTDRLEFYATAYKDLQNPKAMGVYFGLSVTLGPRDSLQGNASYDSGQTSYGVTAQRAAIDPGDLGITVGDTEGANRRRTAQTIYISPWGQVTAGVEQDAGSLATQFGAQGSVVLADGSLFFANAIPDSFAVVSTGDVSGIGVLYENRPVGKTGSDGKLLVPSLLSYQRNTISLDPADLPPDVTVDTGSLRKTVVPADRSWVSVNFGVKRSRGALVRLALPDGKPVPLGSTALPDGSTEPQPVGYNGETYLTGLAAKNMVVVKLPSGTSCKARFDFKMEKGELPVIGPVPCK
jgi:outer membrane usher protein